MTDNDYDRWKLNPPEEEERRIYCRDCDKFRPCPEEVDGGDGWGYCLKWDEYYNVHDTENYC